MASAASYRGWRVALAASLALEACGGVTGESRTDEPNTGTGGRPGTGGAWSPTGGNEASTGGGVPLEQTGGTLSGGESGKGSAGELSYGGRGSAGELSYGGKGTGSRLCELPRARTTSRGEPTGVEDCIAGGAHRSSVEVCAIRVPRAGETCDGDPEQSQCESDADCTEQPYGECVDRGGRLCACDYGCSTDSDCADGAVCICGESKGYCAPATCRSDADCEDGYQCRSFQDPTSPFCGAERFECQTPADSCNANAECPWLMPQCVASVVGVHRCVFFQCIVA